MVTLKLLLMVALFFGLFGYARSTANTPAAGPAKLAISQALLRAGYFKVGECTQPKRLLVESYELDIPSTPQHHAVARIDLISRDGVVVNFAHTEGHQDVPDSIQEYASSSR